MQAIRSRDTAPELAVRQLLHARGLRYRVAARPLADLRRTADIVFFKRKIAVFIDGCFWHGCPNHGRSSFNSNSEYWNAKIAANQYRDAETTRLLEAAGWTVLRFWEHDQPEAVADQIQQSLRAAG